MTLSRDLQAFYTWMAVSRGLSERTATEYCRDIARFQRDTDTAHFDRIKTKKLRKRMSQWFTGLMQDGSNKPQSVHRKIAALHAYCKWLVREERLSENPVDAIERPKAEKRLPHCATLAQVDALLRTRVERRRPELELRDRAMVELMYGSGLRRAEVCGLNLSDVDFENRLLRVIGKGNKERHVFLGEPAEAALQAYLATRPGVLPTDPLFLTIRGERMSVRQLWCVFRDIREAAGLPGVKPHTMRHSFASHLIERGADLVTVKELLGHSNVATTNTYAHVSQAHMRKTFEASHPRAKRDSAVMT